MDTIPPISDTTQEPATAGATAEICWCGQDIEHVRGLHCPRCGTATSTRIQPSPARLAA
jgi:hypothetical protein